MPMISHNVLLTRRTSLYPYLWSVLLVGSATSVIALVHRQINIESGALLYVLVVLLCAAIFGLGPAVLGAGLSFIAFNVFFVPPLFVFAIDDANDVWQFVMFVAAALIGGGLAVRAREQAVAAHARVRETSALYTLSQAISAEVDFRAIAPVILDTAMQLLSCAACALLLPDEHQQQTVFVTTGDWPKDGLWADAPLRSGDQSLGMLRVALARGQGDLPVARRQLLENLATQAALALERSHLAQVVAHSAQLVESDRLKSTLLSAVSHDLRTPLATIIAAADDLAADDIQWTAVATRDMAQLVRDEAERLNHLVTNMLDLTRIEAGVLRPQRGWYNIAEIVYRVVQRLAATLERHRLELAVPDDLPLLPIDYIQIEQVLWNIIENAAKYAPPASCIGVTAHEADDCVVLRISDQGSGIPIAERDRVFERFYRLAQPDNAQVAGAGIGLAISKGIIEAHGGTIVIKDSTTGGSIIEIRLLLTIAETHEAREG